MHASFWSIMFQICLVWKNDIKSSFFIFAEIIIGIIDLFNLFQSISIHDCLVIMIAMNQYSQNSGTHQPWVIGYPHSISFLDVHPMSRRQNNQNTIIQSYCGWLQNPAPPKGWFFNPIDSGMNRPSINWCRISQPSTFLSGIQPIAQ